jgi:3-oxoacyl-[acyl-carrier protein] reductase/bacilysin biosynthesis oxidoreductase BacG
MIRDGICTSRGDASMDLRLHGKRALVTGASQGIGRAIAAGLAAEGVDVAINGRNTASLESAAAEICASTGATVVPVVADVSQPEEVLRLVREAADMLGGLDIVVNNVPAPVFGPFVDHGDDDWQRAIDIKLMGYVRVIRAAIPFLRQQGGVVINNIGSGGRAFTQNHIAGGSTNAALMLITTGLAHELGDLRVRVIGINAGAVQTARHEQLLRSRAESEGRDPEDILKESVAGIPTGRISTPEDIADLAVFLASDRARQINGTTIQIDGGLLRSV